MDLNNTRVLDGGQGLGFGQKANEILRLDAIFHQNHLQRNDPV